MAACTVAAAAAVVPWALPLPEQVCGVRRSEQVPCFPFPFAAFIRHCGSRHCLHYSACPCPSALCPNPLCPAAGPRIFVGKLNKDTSEQDVKDHFMRFGFVLDVYLPRGEHEP